MISEDKSVFLCMAALDSKLYIPPQRIFSAGIATTDGFGGYIKWVKSIWKSSSPPKIGLLYWDRPTGLAWKQAEPWAIKQGVELMPVSYPAATLDLKPQLLSLRDAKVDHIWMLGTANNLAVAVRDFRALDLAGKIPFTFNEYASTDEVIRVAGPAAEGFYDYRAESPFSENTLAAQYYAKVMKKATGEDKWTETRVSLSLIYVMRSSIKQAVADSGWKNLNSESIYTVLNKMTDIDTGGNMSGFGFGPNKRIGVSSIKIKKYTATGSAAASDWISLPRLFEGIEK
jgi:hypothetical protein